MTNFAGNAVATVLIGTWVSEIEADRVQHVLDGEIPFDEADFAAGEVHGAGPETSVEPAASRA